MGKLMKPAEYARELGISRQAVYAKIKKGILTAREVEGKLYIVVDTPTTAPTASPDSPSASIQQNRPSRPSVSKSEAIPREYQRLLAAKDETITVLKETVEDLKESNKQISTTLRGEIELLKSAFSEMRSLYVHRIEQMKASPSDTATEDILEADVKQSEQTEMFQKWIGTKRFFKQQNIIKEKHKEKILKKLKKAYKKGDKRMDKVNGKLKIDATKEYVDILG